MHIIVFLFMALFSMLSFAADQKDYDQSAVVPVYQPVAGVSGDVSSMGSETLNSLMTLWAESFRGFYPQVNFQVQGAGSATAPVALLEGTASLAPMSRRMYDSEIRRFVQRFGYAPYALPVAIDMLAIYVHRDNPLVAISLTELDAAFSVNRLCGASAAIRRWEQLGLTERWQQRDIALFGRNSASGTYAYFKQHVLCQGDFNLRTHQLAGSSAVVQAVSQTPNAIGYAGIGNAAAGVRVVPLYNAERTAVVAPTPENALQGSYPLARVLYLYINKAPAQPLALPEREFLRMVLSSAGQKFIRQEGYQPLPADTVLRIRTELELDTDD